jgi:hypothetical protein
MNATKLLFRTAILALVSTAVLSVSSCKKDDDKDSTPTDFLGTWVTEQTVPTDLGDIQVRDIITFTPADFSEVAKVLDESTNEWIDFIGRKGKIVVRKGSMDVTLTEAGTSELDENGNPTGVITYYKEGTTEFTQILQFMEMEKQYKALYTVSGSSMTLKADNNNNGSYDDEDEVHVFEKQ